MEKFVITISRQFGSLGRPIAKQLSTLLGVRYYDRDIVEAAAEKLKKPLSVISNEEETANTFFKMKYPLGMGTSLFQDEIFQAQKSIVNTMADKSSCIIVGRCADSIFKDHPNSFHVYIYASYEAKLYNCTHELKMEPRTARHMMAEVDAARNAYHKTYAGSRIDCVDNYTMMIDSGRFGVKGTAQVLAQTVRGLYGDQTNGGTDAD